LTVATLENERTVRSRNSVTTDTGDTKKTRTFEKPNKNWRNPRKKNYWQKLNNYNLPF